MDFDVVLKQIKNILNKRFSRPLRLEIKTTSDYYRICCPICGDSLTDDRKKRCCIYPKTFSYFCFNCGDGGTLKKFFNKLKDFITDENFLNEIRNIKVETVDFVRNNDFESFLLSNDRKEIFKQYLIPQDEIIKKLCLKKIKNDDLVFDYLIKKRKLKYIPKNFYKFGNALYILNTLTIDGLEYVYGLEIKNIKNNTYSKYLNYDLKTIYKKFFNKVLDEEVSNKFFSYNFYNFFKIDFSKEFYIFEGTFDAIVFNQYFEFQSFALNGVFKYKKIFDFLKMNDNGVFVFDIDETGLKESLKLFNEGFRVFDFKGFLRHLFKNELDVLLNSVDKLDFNDFMILVIDSGFDLEILKENFYKHRNIYVKNIYTDVGLSTL